jgi:hypothetical protein
MTRTRLFGFAATTAVAIACAASAETWDFKAQFSASNGNPNGAWSYGWMPTDFSSFTLYNTGWSTASSVGWNTGSGEPIIWQNLGTSIAWGVPPGEISLHPGPGNTPSVARWTAPEGVQGIVTLDGEFLPGDGAWLTVSVRHNNSPVWTATDAGVFSIGLSVMPGDTIDFAAYGGYSYGNTPLRAVINSGDCPGDFNGDGIIGAVDITLLLGVWGSNDAAADLDGSGTVDAPDLAMILGLWGAC